MTGRRVLLAIALSAALVGCLQPAYELTCDGGITQAECRAVLELAIADVAAAGGDLGRVTSAQATPLAPEECLRARRAQFLIDVGGPIERCWVSTITYQRGKATRLVIKSVGDSALRAY